MATFTDSGGHEWTLRLTAAALGRLRTEAGLPLKAATFAEQIGTVYDDEPERFGLALWVLCRKQAEGAGVSADDFADRLDGPTSQGALRAVFEELADFYLAPDVATAAKAKAATLAAELTGLATAHLNSSVTRPPELPASAPAG